MKNLHILPTDKPSRLHLWFDKLELSKEFLEVKRNKQHIYITNDDFIDNCWVLNTVSGKVFYNNTKLDLTLPFTKKIILTTDTQLIKDGVQAIDDDFLEWFVKNPKCEEVEILEGDFINGEYTFGKYRIGKMYYAEESKEEPNLETIAEIGKFAERKYLDRLNNFERCDFNDGVFEGVKWQKERSEEEIIWALLLCSNKKFKNSLEVKEWWNNFQKK
jgi:hypothetical protein